MSLFKEKQIFNRMKTEILPFKNFKALDGYHCITNSLVKIFDFNGKKISEDMLLGLGAGMGFIYWKMKLGDTTSIFIGGRGNNKDFFTDLGRRTGVKISCIYTSSSQKAENSLLNKLNAKEPVMMFGDMGFLPWFEFPEEYHFGGHSFVICGFDGAQQVLASDMDPKATGLKKGFYYPVSLAELARARNSEFKPFPPKNGTLEFDFTQFHQPLSEDIYSAIKQCIESELHPPIKNLGIKGLNLSSKEILKWPGQFNEKDLRMNLFSLYIFFEIGGTGGGCFRYMYSRFLREAAGICRNKQLVSPAEKIHHAGEIYSQIGNLFKDSAQHKDLDERIKIASELFLNIAELEEEAFTELDKILK